MNRHWAAVAPAAALPALVAGIGLALLPGAAGAATPSAPPPSPTPAPLSVVIPLPSPLPTLNLLTTGGSVTNPLAGLFPTETETIPQMQAALFADVNAERAAAGLGPVATNAWAQSIAMGHSQDMANARTIWHNYTGYVDAAKQAIDAYVDGENVGMAETLVQVDAALMASPEHKANILYPLFNTIGVGVAQDANGYVYVTEDFADIRPAGAAVVSKPPTAAARPQAPAAAPAGAAPNPAAAVAPAAVVAPVAAASPIVVASPPPSSRTAAPEAAAPMPAAAALAAAPASSPPGSRPAAVAVATLLAVAAAAAARRRRARRVPAGGRASGR